MFALGGLAGALAASSCCLVPLALFSLGADGAWLGHLTRFAPYQPLFVAFAVASVGLGFWTMRKATRAEACAGTSCRRPSSRRMALMGLWAAVTLLSASVLLDVVGPMLLG